MEQLSRLIQQFQQEQNDIISEHFRFQMSPIDIISEMMENEMLEQALEQSREEEQPVQKQVLSDDGRKELLYMTYTNKDHMSSVCDNHECPISQDEFEEGEEIIILPCKHAFMEENIMRWLEKESATCPVCRHALSSITKIEKQKLN